MELASDNAWLPQVSQMVAEVRRNPHMELEVRLGTISERRVGENAPTVRFEAGVSPEYSEEVYRSMTDEKSIQQCWHGRLPVLKNFTYKYFAEGPNTVRGYYHEDGSPPIYNRIRKVNHVNLHCPTRPYGLRVSLKVEEPLANFFTPEPATTMRVNTRCTMINSGSWQYEFTKTGHGPTIEAACANLAFMIELELVRNEALFQQHGDQDIAIMLVGRARALLGLYNAAGCEEPLELVVKQ